MGALQEEEMIAGTKVSRGERLHQLFLKFGEIHHSRVEFGEVSIHCRPTRAMKPPVCLPKQ